MKFLFVLCFLLLSSCGSPLDEGYWKEYNQEAQPDDKEGQEIEYSINLGTLHAGINIDFSSQTFKKLKNGKISISSEVSLPDDVSLTRYRIEVAPCSNYPDGGYTSIAPDQTTTFNRNSSDLSQIADQPNKALVGQFLYVYATIGAGGTIQVRLACSEITR